jgi:UDP-glucuronate 4-epimerase
LKILVSGTAGFIGFHLVKKLSSLGFFITGIDNINDYYDVNLKYARLKQSGIKCDKIEYGKKINSSTIDNYSFIRMDLTDRESLFSLFAEEQFDYVCNLAAQAGVRYSLENPYSYIESNINGFMNILEACRNNKIRHLVFASSSSVYGMNEKTPFSVDDKTDFPVSLYAATKKSNELMAYTYAHLYNIPSTGLRFFTVYGPWGRPDMAYYKFAISITEKKPIEVYNHGDMLRDFTYIDDIIEGIVASINHIPSKEVASKEAAPFNLYNLGNNNPEKLTDYIETLERHLGLKAEKIYLKMQPGDVPVTMADIEKTYNDLGWKPKTNINDGLKLFSDWFLEVPEILNRKQT